MSFTIHLCNRSRHCFRIMSDCWISMGLRSYCIITVFVALCVYKGDLCSLVCGLGKCRNGFHGKHCNQECLVDGHCRGKCRHCHGLSCNRYTCSFECDNTWWGPKCDKRCSKRCVKQACNSRSGRCSLGCTPGFYADDCGGECSGNCLKGHCEPNDGSCNGCKAGSYGPKCTQTCSTYCGHVQCNGQTGLCKPCVPNNNNALCHEGCFNTKCTACQQVTGRCSECEQGWYGDTCFLRCAEGCLDNICSIDGECQCKDGYYGALCDQTCPENCHHEICHIRGFCNNCSLGFSGSRCESKCSPNCKDDECSQQSGVCVRGCRKGYHGQSCNLACSEGCAEGECDQATALCLRGCKSTVHGKYCENTCSATCPRHMCHTVERDIDYVACSLDCPDGRWGSMCELACSHNCRSCNRSTGVCGKCKSGWNGPTCSLNCSLGCKNTLCENNGTCTEGCRDGLYMDDCSDQCPKHCRTCERISGLCMSCIAGWRGDSCTESSASTRIMVVVSVLLGVVVFILTFICAFKRYRQQTNGSLYLSPIDQYSVHHEVFMTENLEGREEAHYAVIPDSKEQQRDTDINDPHYAVIPADPKHRASTDEEHYAVIPDTHQEHPAATSDESHYAAVSD